MLGITAIRDKRGYSLVELLVAISIIGILSVIAVPQYSNFVAKGKVKSATGDLLQNARLARTLAIKENQTYVIAFNLPGANSYSIGFDTNGDGTPEGYDNGPVRVINLQTEYGNDVVFGTFTASGPGEPDTCPACIDISGSTVTFAPTIAPVYEQFNPDGSVGFTGSAFITHTTLGFTYMMRVSYQSGKFDLWKWDGEAGNPSPQIVNNCVTAPVQYCGWTELR